MMTHIQAILKRGLILVLIIGIQSNLIYLFPLNCPVGSLYRNGVRNNIRIERYCILSFFCDIITSYISGVRAQIGFICLLEWARRIDANWLRVQQEHKKRHYITSAKYVLSRA